MSTDEGLEVPRADGAADRCAYCGAELAPGTGLALDLRRPAVPVDDAGKSDAGYDDEGDSDRVGADFCSEEHAARWLDGGGPPIAVRHAPRAPLSGADRVTAAVLLLGIVLLVGLTLVGVWTVGGWLF